MAASLRRLLLAAIYAGAASGTLLFALQYVTMGPLIARAESYERAAAPASDHDHAEAWEPAEGAERTTFTAIGTVLTGIAFAAITLGGAVALGIPLDWRRGAVLGLVGYAVFVAAPSVGLPPAPPGVPGADVAGAQAWWVLTAMSTLAGLIVIGRSPRKQIAWGLGLALVAAPHLVGAPASQSAGVVPHELAIRFAWTSVVSRLPFWLVLGCVGGHCLHDEMPLGAAGA
jgi:cobalt transporter subunit CbtA